MNIIMHGFPFYFKPDNAIITRERKNSDVKTIGLMEIYTGTFPECAHKTTHKETDMTC